MLVYSCASTMTQNLLRNSFWKGFFVFFFQIFAKIEMMRAKNHLFDRLVETVIVFSFFPFFFFCLNMVVFSEVFITKFHWESSFLKGVPMEPPLGHQRVGTPWLLTCTC